ncbi:MAG: ribbon-helix-helix protein, CopG family [Rhizobiaceae bacterium]
METAVNPVIDKHRAYRRRLAANGNHQLVVALPRETVALLDEIKERRGLRNRSQVLLQLIERGKETDQED